MNLPVRAMDILAPVELHWLKIATQLDDEAGFLTFVAQALARL